MAKSALVPAWQRALMILTGTVVVVVVVSCLYWAQIVFIPVAVAVFLTFLLAPLVTMLQRRGLWRTPSVVLVVLLSVLIMVGIGWLVTVEITTLAGELPTYTENIKGKIRSLRQIGQGSLTDRLETMIQDIAGEWNSQLASPEQEAADKQAGAGGAVPGKPTSVFVHAESPAWLSRMPAVFGHIVESIGGLALVLVLVIFMLLKRETLRNRLIRLIGHGRLTVTTKALDDAGQRISRFLLMQLLINVSYGLALAIGLFAIQVPHALLWGFLAAVLRYVPYLGMMITSLVLLTLSLATFPGWVQPLLVLGLIVVLELITYNVMEPWLFSQSTGVSEVAVLVSAALWAFLWGPVGLILSSPLTVCLVVLGKYVPQLEFLDVILGDAPALAPNITFYQRLLARDQDEATHLVLSHVKTLPPEQVYDELLVPALNYTRQDRERDDLTEADELFVLHTIQEIVEDLGERRSEATPTKGEEPPENRSETSARVHLLACPARDEADRLALEMLQQLLDPVKWSVEVTAVETLTAELLAQVAEQGPALICIGALPPGGLAHTRYLCKRLRARFPEIKIAVGRWGLKGNVESNQEQLQEAGATVMTTTLLEMRNQLNSWLPVLAFENARAAAG